MTKLTPAQLRAENAALRELLAAVRETAEAGQPLGDGCDTYFAGHRAAARISIWLDDIDGRDTVGVANIAAMFRKYVGEIAKLADASKSSAA